MFFNNNTKVTRVERKIVINQQAADIEEAGKITKNIKGRLELAGRTKESQPCPKRTACLSKCDFNHELKFVVESPRKGGESGKS